MAWVSNFDDFEQSVGQSGGGISRFAGRGNLPLGQEHQTDEIRSIADLTLGMPSSKIVGVIIAKGEPRHFPNKKDFSSERYVFSFTLRDSPSDYINVTCWGGEQYIMNLASLFHIGHVVQVDHADIQSKPPDGSDEKFRPWTPSPYQLSLNETRGSLTSYDDWNMNQYLQLLQVPVKPSNDFYTICDVLTNGPTLNGEVINILAVVRQVGQVKHMRGKNGRELQRLDVKLFDDSAATFSLVLWDEELINMAQSWVPKENIIFATDVRVRFDEWKKMMVATAIAKTILIVNPDTKEARHLYQYALSVDLESEDFDSLFGESDQSVPLNQITDVYKIVQLKDLHSMERSNSKAIYGIVYAFISMLDIDDSISAVISMRCSCCHLRITKDSLVCDNVSCPPSTNPELNEFTKAFEIRVSLSDETGTITGCFLTSDVAEKLLACTVEEFLNLGDAERTELKWKFLLEKCKVYLKVSQLTAERRLLTTRILSCEMADIQEAAFAIDSSC